MPKFVTPNQLDNVVDEFCNKNDARFEKKGDTQGIIAPVEVSPSENAYSIGESLIYNDVLYDVIADISVGDELVVNTNIHVSDTICEQLADIKEDIGDLTNLSTTAKSSIVAAINEVAQTGGSGGGSGGSSGGRVIAEVTGDGTTTCSDCLDELYAQIQAAGGFSVNKNYTLIWEHTNGDIEYYATQYYENVSSAYSFYTLWRDGNNIDINYCQIQENGSDLYTVTSKDSTNAVNKSSTATSDTFKIIEVGGGAGSGSGSGGYEVLAEVTGDGSMTNKDALNSLYAQIMANGGINPMQQYALLMYSADYDNYDTLPLLWYNFPHDDDSEHRHELFFEYTYGSNNDIECSKFVLRSSDSQLLIVSSKDSVNAKDQSNNVLPTYMTYKVIRYGSSSSGASSEEIGDLEDLTTSAKTDLVSAINEVNTLANGERIELVEAETDTTFSAQIDKFYSPLSQLTDEQLLNTFVTCGNIIFRYINHTNDRYIYSCVIPDERDAYGNVFNIDRVIVKSSGSKFYDTNVNGTTHTANDFTNASMSSEEAMGLYMQASQTTVRTPEMEVLDTATNKTLSDSMIQFVSKISSMSEKELMQIKIIEYGTNNCVFNFIQSTDTDIIFKGNSYSSSNTAENSFALKVAKDGSSASATLFTYKANTAIASQALTYQANKLELIRVGGSSSGVEVLAHVEGAANLYYADALESITTQLLAADIGDYLDNIHLEIAETDQSNDDFLIYDLRLVELFRDSNGDTYGFTFDGLYIAGSTHNSRHTYTFYFENNNNRIFDNGSNVNYNTWTAPEGSYITVYRRK